MIIELHTHYKVQERSPPHPIIVESIVLSSPILIAIQCTILVFLSAVSQKWWLLFSHLIGVDLKYFVVLVSVFYMYNSEGLYTF